MPLTNWANSMADHAAPWASQTGHTPCNPTTRTTAPNATNADKRSAGSGTWASVVSVVVTTVPRVWVALSGGTRPCSLASMDGAYASRQHRGTLGGGWIIYKSMTCICTCAHGWVWCHVTTKMRVVPARLSSGWRSAGTAMDESKHAMAINKCGVHRFSRGGLHDNPGSCS